MDKQNPTAQLLKRKLSSLMSEWSSTLTSQQSTAAYWSCSMLLGAAVNTYGFWADIALNYIPIEESRQSQLIRGIQIVALTGAAFAPRIFKFSYDKAFALLAPVVVVQLCAALSLLHNISNSPAEYSTAIAQVTIAVAIAYQMPAISVLVATSGSAIAFHILGGPGPDSSINLIALVGFLANRTLSLIVSERSRLERAEAIELISRNSAHEIKSPLLHIRNWSDVMMDGLQHEPIDPKELFEMALRIRKIADNAIEDANDFLASTQLDAIESQEHGIHSVRDLLAKFATRDPASNARITTDLQSPDFLVRISNRVFLRIIRNLVENSIRSIDLHGSGTVRIFTERTKTSNRVIVLDTGGGVLKQHRSRIFERGFSLTRGTGYGLPYCRDMMRSIQGDLKLERGTTSTSMILIFPVVNMET